MRCEEVAAQGVCQHHSLPQVLAVQGFQQSLVGGPVCHIRQSPLQAGDEGTVPRLYDEVCQAGDATVQAYPVLHLDEIVVALRTSCENLAHNLQKRKSV